MWHTDGGVQEAVIQRMSIRAGVPVINVNTSSREQKHTR